MKAGLALTDNKNGLVNEADEEKRQFAVNFSLVLIRSRSHDRGFGAGDRPAIQPGNEASLTQNCLESYSVT